MNYSLLDQKYEIDVIMKLNHIKKIEKAQRSINNFRISKEIWFKDMIWDFNYLNKNNRARNQYTFNFESISEPFIFYVKVTILNEILIKKNSIGAVKRTYRVLKTITKDLFNNKVFDVRLLDKEKVKIMIEKKMQNCKLSYIEGLGVGLKKMIFMIEEIEEYNMQDVIAYLNKICVLCNQNRTLSAVNEYIPNGFLNQIVSIALRDIDNPNLKIDYRIVACLIVIIAETGMRAEEVSLIETNKLDVIKVNNKELGYLKFLTFKTQQYRTEGKETYTWLSDKALKAYKMCEKFANQIIDNLSENSKLRLLIYLNTKKEFRRRVMISELRGMVSKIDKKRLSSLEKESRKYIFISGKTGRQKTGCQVLRENFERFFIRHYDDFNIEDIPYYQRKNIKKIKIKSEAKYKKLFPKNHRKNLSFEEVKNHEYLYVNPHMFRVTVCTKLFLQGVHIDFIVKHMNHLSEEMTIYYNKSQEFVDVLTESIKILSNITNDKGLIETNPELIDNEFLKKEMSNKEFKEKIEVMNEFLEKNKLNIITDFDKVIRILEKTSSPIIENELGLCIRSIVYGICEKRKYFSSISDYYFIGPQLNTFKFIHHSYERFKQKIKIVKHNRKVAELDERYLLEYEREEKALKTFIMKTLKIEISLLENDIDKYGIEEIIMNYPQLESIIYDISEIKEEISQWIK